MTEADSKGPKFPAPTSYCSSDKPCSILPCPSKTSNDPFNCDAGYQDWKCSGKSFAGTPDIAKNEMRKTLRRDGHLVSERQSLPEL